MALGAVLALFLCDSKNVERKDGTHVIVMKQPSWTSELLGALQCFRTDYYIIAFFPMFLASNWFYTYQFNDVNLAKFNVRTRALNNTPLLVRSNHRRLHLRLCPRLQGPSTNNPCKGGACCSFLGDYGDLGRWLRFPTRLHSRVTSLRGRGQARFHR